MFQSLDDDQNERDFNMISFIAPWTVVVVTFLQICGGQEGQQGGGGRWQDNIRPKLFAHLSSRDYQSFSGVLLNDPASGLNTSLRENNNPTR